MLRRKWRSSSVRKYSLVAIFALFCILWTTKNGETEKFSVGREKKIILLWHERVWKKKSLDETRCGSCSFTSDRTLLGHPSTAVVLFRSENIEPDDMPTPEIRRTDQHYVWTAGEPPPALFHLRKKFLLWENKFGFNLTLSYRTDSSLYHPYGTVSEAIESVSQKGYLRNLGKLLKSKEKLAVAAVSNCASTSAADIRLEILRNLRERHHFSAEYFGKCFSNTYDNNFQSLLSKYKFFLAFENSYHCKDYITEKFYRNALYVGVVPVVWGSFKADYEKVAPKNSFIHLEDFATMTELVGYLNYLDGNDSAYLEYFRWYGDALYSTSVGRDESYCSLCKIATFGLESIKTDAQSAVGETRYFKQTPTPVKSLHSWFYGGNHRDCLRTRLRIGPDAVKPH